MQNQMDNMQKKMDNIEKKLKKLMGNFGIS